ncbi:DinB family protein [Gammaproteobacteria bacterium AB-CW1]|uniref:DinB family protein n=1 Tax=Natronospira elongata TaxID=3110268 RepID=A0AAP6MKX6_9GAMM|nr:DinB family protein [Gammaproteobacteria bacterium AB-CW1]
MRDEALTAAIEEHRDYLDQLSFLVRELDPEAYRLVDGPHGRYCIGKHLRHILDHCWAVLHASGSRIDYEQRDRNSLVESSPHAALESLAALREGFDAWVADRSGGETVSVQWQDTSGEVITARSSLIREVLFLSSHAVHHMAVIAMIVRQRGLELPPEFGLATSTRRYWAAQTDDEARKQATPA